MRIAIVGSGFAGSILARLLAVQGHDVTLLERGRHPRFAIGESSTPLAAICLERLAHRYGQEDLDWLAAHGRWTRALPELGRGLKRGFTFFAHDRGRHFGADGVVPRLLVAASPNDEIADVHWVRADVDEYLVRRAVDAGVAYFDDVTLSDLQRSDGWTLTVRHPDGDRSLHADLIVDATGPAAVVARNLGARDARSRIGLTTRALYGHFSDVGDFVADARRRGVDLPEGPYPDERAAVHHLIDEGWMWVLPFDHGVVSAGIVLEEDAGAPNVALPPAVEWTRILAAYPSLAEQFGRASALHHIRRLPAVQHRLDRAGGDGWVALPHTFAFVSPMFSTGMAWSLAAVERLALVLETARGPDDVGPGLERYAQLLEAEATHVTTLIEGAYRLRSRFDRFASYALVYFAAASFAEASQRLLDVGPDGDPWAWSGFLGATDPVTRSMIDTATQAAHARTSDEEFARAIRESIAARDVAGLGNPDRAGLYPVDLEALVESADLLGLSAQAIRAALPRLRGMG